MNKRILSCMILLASGALSSCAVAADLIDVYNQALKSDPTFAQAEANWLSSKEQLPIARAGIFPQVTLTGDATRTFNRQDSANVVAVPNWSTNYDYNLNLAQPILNYAAWMTIRQAGASVKSATATYFFSGQDLMVRTAQAYFNVLKAYENLRFTLAQERTVYRTLEQQRQEYKVGLIAITGVYDAESTYDTTVAEEISDRNLLSDALENLRAITGVYYISLKGLQSRVPLVKPNPSNINDWVDIAIKQNYSLIAQKYAVDAARQNIKVQEGAGFPTIGLNGSYGHTYNSSVQGSQVQVSNSNSLIGLSLNYPLFTGGLVDASTQQARYQFLTASGQLEFVYRNTVNLTRQSYLGVTALISKIHADLQAIRSKQKELAATRAGYVVGTRTMVDVLKSIQDLTEAQKVFANDQYDYINQTILLKEQAGTLSLADLQQINRWLKAQLEFNPKQRNDLPKAPKHVNPYQSADKLHKDALSAPFHQKPAKLPPTTQRDTRTTEKAMKAAAANTESSTSVSSPATPANSSSVTDNAAAASSATTTTGVTTQDSTTTTAVSTPPSAVAQDAAPANAEQSTKTATDVSTGSQQEALAPSAAAGYTIQLYASRQFRDAEKFIHTHKHLMPLDITAAHHNNQTWYRVVYGHYTSKQQAIKARNQLAHLRGMGNSWIREA